MSGPRRAWWWATALVIASALPVTAPAAAPPGADTTGRQALRRRAAVAVIVETFDRQLFLDAARRAAVAAALEAHWQPGWEAVLVPPRQIQFSPVPNQPPAVAQPRQPFPRGVEECVLQALGPELAAAWLASQPTPRAVPVNRPRPLVE